MSESSLADDQQVARFIYEDSKIFKSTGKPRPNLFWPRYEAAFVRWETSVCHLNECTDNRVWAIAWRIPSLKGRADVEVSNISQAKLRCLSSPDEPDYPEHAAIVDWPDDKEQQKLRALLIANSCRPIVAAPMGRRA